MHRFIETPLPPLPHHLCPVSPLGYFHCRALAFIVLLGILPCFLSLYQIAGETGVVLAALGIIAATAYGIYKFIEASAPHAFSKPCSPV